MAPTGRSVPRRCDQRATHRATCETATGRPWGNPASRCGQMTNFDLALLILRLAVGLTFAAHGAQKAFGWWGGPGPARWLKSVHGMGFHPPALFAAAAVGGELIGGLALAFGFLTPIAAGVLAGVAGVVTIQVHWSNGVFKRPGGLG